MNNIFNKNENAKWISAPWMKDIDTPAETDPYSKIAHIGGGEPLKPDDHMTMIEMLNWYDQMRKKKYEPGFILKQLISRFTITRK